MKSIVVIGAGVGGLTTAAVLARAGLDVTVLEAHIYAGGSAGTFFHQGYRFDAGATLAGGFSPGGPMDLVARCAGVPRWPVLPERPDLPAMTVHLPGGLSVDRWGDERRHAARFAAFGPAGERFFEWQERAADALWSLALRGLPWPPQTAAEAARLLAQAGAWIAEDPRRLSVSLVRDLFRPAAAQLQGAPEALRRFVDAQLLISAQATSERANALYAAAALDLPRRGVAHIAGGMGGIAAALVEAVRAHGGRVRFRQEAVRIRVERGRAAAVETRQGGVFPADLVIANLTAWDLRRLLGASAPPRLQSLPPPERAGWGAFMLYLGVDDEAVSEIAGLHHQVVPQGDLGEGQSVFISISPPDQADRAPEGARALTLSTHTSLGPWWEAFEKDRAAYEQRKETYTDRMLQGLESVLPEVRDAIRLRLPGTPVTFRRFTRRAAGWVGGYPQTDLFKVRGPRVMPGLWQVGDSIFPGQSVAAVALGGLRTAAQVITKTKAEAAHRRDSTDIESPEQWLRI